MRKDDNKIMSEIITEKCGVIGMINKSILCSDFCKAFAPLQNRGEDAAGVVWLDAKNNFQVKKNAGTILELFDDKKTPKLPHASSLWLGHNRYATSAGTSPTNIQPFIGQNGPFTLALGHNGNLITDTMACLGTWVNTRYIPGSSDSALTASYMLQQRPTYSSWTETFMNELPKLRGSFSLVMATEEKKLYAARDPQGIGEQAKRSGVFGFPGMAELQAGKVHGTDG